MNDSFSNWILSLCLGLAVAPGGAMAAEISYFKGTSNEDLDAAIIERLTDQGHTVTEFLPGGVEEAEQLAETADKDLVIISETIGSVQVTDTQAAGGAFTLRNLPKPIISFEVYHWDEAFWTRDVQYEDFGNTGRPEVFEEPLQELLDTLYIKDPSHPMAAGLSGAVKVYKEKFSFNFGKTPVGTRVIATVDEAGEFPTHFEIPKGTTLVDGSITPERRIGIFFAQGSGIVDDPPGQLADFEFLSDEGLALFDAAVNYALSSGGGQAGPPADVGPVKGENFVKVGDIGNPEDADQGYGSVDYEYYFSKFEVTVGEYAAFLNSAAKSDDKGLYDPNMSIDQNGNDGSFTYEVIDDTGKRPIRWVEAVDCMRFCNWLHNGATDAADTEDGAYSFEDPDLPGPRNPGARFFMPTEDEWYKAAHYDPTKDGGKGGYWYYAVQSDQISADPPPGGKMSANFDAVARGEGEVTDVDAYPLAVSYYGTHDQSGNVWEWLEPDPAAPDQSRRRSGSWENNDGRLGNDQSGQNSVTAGVSMHQGIRIAAAPAFGGASIDLPFQITRLAYLPGEQNSVVVTWNSKPDGTYTVFRSGNLTDWEEVTDGLQSAGNTTTLAIDLAIPPESEVYVYVKEE